MKTFAFSAILALVLVFAATPSRADDKVYACGQALKAEFQTDPGPSANFCDIYSRQIAYGVEKKKFYAMLKERQKNFAVPRDQAWADYQKNLAAYYKTVGDGAGDNTGNR